MSRWACGQGWWVQRPATPFALQHPHQARAAAGRDLLLDAVPLGGRHSYQPLSVHRDAHRPVH